MKLVTTITILLLQACFAQLPAMNDRVEWLGYFTAWEDRKSAFGIGDDGSLALYRMTGDGIVTRKNITARLVVQEKKGGKWQEQMLMEEGGLTSEAKPGINPREPVVLQTSYVGGLKLKWTFIKSRGEYLIKPELVENLPENELRIGVEMKIPGLYSIKKDMTPEKIESILDGDLVRGVRMTDGRRVKVDMDEPGVVLTDEKNLKGGVSSVEIRKNGFEGNKLSLSCDPKNSLGIAVRTPEKYYAQMRLFWTVPGDKLGLPGNHLTFEFD